MREPRSTPFLAHTARTLATGIGMAGVTFGAGLLLARSLGPTGRGEIAAAMLWPILLTYIGSTGLVSTLAYMSARSVHSAQEILSTATTLALLQGLAAGIIGYLLLPFLVRGEPGSVAAVSRWFLCVIPISLLTLYGTSVLQGRMRIGAYNVLRALVAIAYLVALTGLWVTHSLSVGSAVLAQLGANAVALIATAIALYREGVVFKPGFHGPLAREMLHFGFRVQAGDLAALANDRLDQVILVAWVPPASLGLYVAAVGAASIPQLFSNALRMVALPTLSAIDDPAARVTSITRIFRTYWWISLAIGLVLALVLPVAIPLVYGHRFAAAALPAEILVLGAVLIGAKEVLGAAAQAMGRPIIGSQAEGAAVVVTVILLAALVPPLGIVGAAIASVLAYAVATAVSLYGLNRQVAVSPGSLFHLSLRDLRDTYSYGRPARGSGATRS